MCKLPEEDVIDLWEIDYEVDFDYILITPTIGFGKVPEDVERFLKGNYKHLKGVVGSGNKNWGNRFAKAAEIISAGIAAWTPIIVPIKNLVNGISNTIKIINGIARKILTIAVTTA